MITAVVLITAEKGALPKLGEALAAVEGVSEVYSVTGDFDFVAMVRAREHDELADIVTQRIAQVPGVAGVAVRRRYFTLRSGDAPHRSAALARRAFAFQQLDRVRCRRVQLDGRARRVRVDRDLRDDDLDIHVLARPRKYQPGHSRRDGLPDDRAGPRFHDRDQRPGGR